MSDSSARLLASTVVLLAGGLTAGLGEIASAINPNHGQIAMYGFFLLLGGIVFFAAMLMLSMTVPREKPP